MTDVHRITEVRHVGRGSWVAYCLCGHPESKSNRANVLVAIYQHVINASRPACPTPHKTAYGSEIEALNAIRKFLRYTAPGPRPARAYECPSGQHWHTTKSPLYQPRQAA